ncbi:discoidin domain-containing protein [Kribbella catacumbae]|uniref:discoidin domain-containing protein n=1 Tax=Kribbella catacumbae TaxID=460086 RepID=UPI000A06FABB|nr:discoidin domain-containing protein [Kribbella catacumbae]
MPRKPRLSAVLALAGVLLTTAVAVPTEAAAAPIPVQLLSLTDLHGYLSETENLTIAGPSGSLAVGGAAYLKAHLDKLRAGQPNSFLIGSGDQFSGWPDYTQAFANEPTIEVLNAFGMDFDVAGNHEFDRELPFLRRMVTGACYGKPGFDTCFPDSTGRPFHGTDYAYHAANVVNADSKQPVLPPYWIAQAGTARIGVIGLGFPGTPTETLSIKQAGLEFQGLVEAANRAAAELKAQGVNAIAVSIHEGGQQGGLFNDCKNPTGPIFDAARAMSPDIDVILGGHWHTAFNCMIPDPNGVPRPVLEASNHGRLLGEVNLSLDPATGEVIRSATKAANHAVTKDLTPDPAVQKIVKYWMDKWKVRQGQPLAKLDRDLDFSKTAESRTGNLVADLYRSEAAHTADGAADFALVPADLGVDVIAAGLKAGTVPFGAAWPVVGISPITTLALKGSTVEEILEQQWIPPAYGCRRLSSLAVSDQVRYTYDLGKPVGDRVDPAKVFIRGKRLELGKTYRVATSAAMPLHGTQYGYPGFGQYTDLVRAPRMGQEVFLNHLRRSQSITAPALGRVTAIPGTPPPVDGPFGPLTLLPQNEMTATATSQGSASYSAAAALDGSCTTMWHSNWSPHAPLPQYITLNLGTTRSIEALVYTPRQDAAVPNGRISKYDVQVSADGIVFQSVATGNWDGTVDAKLARFPTGTAARYVRLIGLEGGADYAAATELNIALTPGS